ncbi:MAG: hypothetical protein CYPHOPRED_001783 [Cyphobasidiales sp. Tagirdzhanova-0007]|nr:MAG: hypothetical protein CYPHOPRED_001783 [Cyphobasidiales sp. Tagirdzhanova-0007]
MSEYAHMHDKEAHPSTALQSWAERSGNPSDDNVTRLHVDYWMFESRNTALAFWSQSDSTFRAKFWILAPPTQRNLERFGVAAAAGLQIRMAAITDLEMLDLAVVEEGETLWLPAGWLQRSSVHQQLYNSANSMQGLTRPTPRFI